MLTLKYPEWQFSYKFKLDINFKMYVVIYMYILNQIVLILLASIALQVLRKEFVVQGFSFVCVIIYVNVQFTPRRVINLTIPSW